MQNRKANTVKSIHSVVFIFMVLCLAYILYAAVAGAYDWLLLLALGFIFLEGGILILNGWQCPLTELSARLGDEKGAATMLFLPTRLVPHTFKIFGVLFTIGLVWLFVGYFFT